MSYAVKTAPYWDTDLAKIEKKLGKVRQMAQFLRTKHKDHANKDGKMSPKQQQAWLKNYRSEVLTPEEETEWKRGGSNGDYHYLGSAKTMAQIGKAFADALISSMIASLVRRLRFVSSLISCPYVAK